MQIAFEFNLWIMFALNILKLDPQQLGLYFFCIKNYTEKKDSIFFSQFKAMLFQLIIYSLLFKMKLIVI